MLLSKVESPSMPGLKGAIDTTTTELTSPPSYTSQFSTDPPLDITAAFSNLDLGTTHKPTPDLCLAHLKLLESFYQLRLDVSKRDGLFGISDDFADAVAEPGNERNSRLAQIREKRWEIYVTKAARRFEQWWKTCVQPDRQLQEEKAVWGHTADPRAGQILELANSDMPPLDVIMVWHAYHLNPRKYLSDCMRSGKTDIWRTGFPWEAIIPCIDDHLFEFIPGPKAETNFEMKTKLQWNSLDDPQHTVMQCPKCKRHRQITWTGWDRVDAWRKVDSDNLAGEKEAKGLSDKNFHQSCECQFIWTHEVLQLQKFRQDCFALCDKGIPMQGTLLTQTGLPCLTSKFSEAANFFPNRLLRGKGPGSTLHREIVDNTQARWTAPIWSSLQSLKAEIEKALADREYVKSINNNSLTTTPERMAVRRMMACYWGNPSSFGLDLVGAVIRQGNFIEKMHKIDWLHSPVSSFTMKRLVQKYERFFTLVAACPKQEIAVPTLDVDLAWHTHQLQPKTYYHCTVSVLYKYLDHDDKVEDTILAKGFEWISKEYQKRYGELYSECTCWYCESVRESFAPKLDLGNLKRKIRGKPSVLEEQLNQLHSSADPSAESAHISAHNAIKPNTTRSRLLRERNIKTKLERDYQKAIARAKKRGYEPPRRDEYLYAYAYPIWMPAYVPFEGDPCVSNGMYAANPSCASFVPGDAGNCAAGSCGGAIAAGGSCGGLGACSAGGSLGGCTTEGGDGSAGDGGCSGCGGCGGCG